LWTKRSNTGAAENKNSSALSIAAKIFPPLGRRELIRQTNKQQQPKKKVWH
jgi:hypothetical protein